jgi:hypothetical protein
MNSIAHIKELIEKGETSKALGHLENILFLGPKNIEALKLKAFILRAQGHFEEEEILWSKILSFDREDTDAMEYFYSRHLEERENFYFTDPLPQGRRYLGSSRALLIAGFSLFCGSFVFLWLAQIFGKSYQNIQIGIFFVLVCLPFFGMLWSYLFSLRHVLIHEKGLLFKTLFRSYGYLWDDISSVHLTYNLKNHKNIKLYLVFIPKAPTQKPIRLDVTQDRASIRSRKLFLKDLKTYFGPILPMDQESMLIGPREILSF